MFDPIMIQLVRKTAPSLIAEQIVGVQPMQGDIISKLCTMRTYTQSREYQQGELIHSFIYGYQRYYGTEFISNELWLQLKIKGL